MYDEGLVFDIGLHRGEDAEFYLAKGFRVVGVEASSDLAKEAADRLRAAVDDARLIIENVAVAEKSGPVTFYLSANSVWGTTNPEWAERYEHQGYERTGTVTVEGVTFSDLIARHGVPYFLKVDIEGADMLCLRGLLEVPDRPKYVSIESEKIRWSSLVDEFNLLERLGYHQFKIVPQHKVDKQVQPSPPREGKYAPGHTFNYGASGLFGEEAPGRWLTKAQALALYRAVFLRYRLIGDSGVLHKVRLASGAVYQVLREPGWYDTHARLG
jgi:FkbM family methyltransferase